MTEIEADYSTNVALVFAERFNEAWSRSRTPNIAGGSIWFLRRFWLLGIAITAGIGALFIDGTNVGVTTFLGGILTGLVANYLPSVPDWTQKLISRFKE
jgi:hypothetical protein